MLRETAIDESIVACMKTIRKSGFTLLEIMIVVGIIGILAAIVTPHLRNSLGKAQKQACAINRKNIDGAKLQWALENKQPATAIPTDDDLFGENAYVEHKPECPASGTYDIKAVKEKCTCSMGIHSN